MSRNAKRYRPRGWQPEDRDEKPNREAGRAIVDALRRSEPDFEPVMSTDDGNCVGGFFLDSILGVRDDAVHNGRAFPNREMIAAGLLRFPLVDSRTAMRAAAEIISANDSADFALAWQILASAMSV